MPTGTIPKTIEAAKADLSTIDYLLTANEWLRAAIVHAFTRDGEGGATEANRSTSTTVPMTPRQFAALGIKGLKSDRTVRGYRKAWQEAMKAGEPNYKPGDEFVVPNLPWPPAAVEQYRGSRATEAETREYIVRNPQVVVEAVKASPAVAEAVTTAIVDDNDLANTVARKSFAKSIGAKDNGPTVPTTNIPTFDYEKRLSAAITVVSEAIKDEKSGTWTPGPGEAAMLTILFLNLKDRADRYADAQPVVHSEIDDFLRENNTAKED